MVFLGPCWCNYQGLLHVYVFKVSEKQQRMNCNPQEYFFYSMMLNMYFVPQSKLGGYENMSSVWGEFNCVGRSMHRACLRAEKFLRKEKSGSQQALVKSEQGTQLVFFLLLWVTCIAGNRVERHTLLSSNRGTFAFSAFCYSVEKE